jgi:hypothetical protein
LAWFTDSESSYRIELCDPHTGAPLADYDGDDEADPANYYTVVDKGQSKRLNLNCGDPEQIEKLIRSCVGEVNGQGNGDLMILCPFHSDINPSCSVSPKKNGCWHCFGCGESGSLTTLIAKLRGIAAGEAIGETAAAFGQKVEYRQPDANALAVYSYRDSKGKLLKQVLRYPNEDGEKVFRQRRPGKGAWIWNTSGLPPMLLNAELLDLADVVCITEGEKDVGIVRRNVRDSNLSCTRSPNCYKCHAVRSIPTAAAAAEFAAMLKRLQPTEILMSQLPIILKEEWKKRTADSTVTVRQLSAQLKQQEEEHSRLIRKYVNDDPHVVKIFEEWNTRFEEEIASLKGKIAEAEMEKATFEELWEFSKSLLVDISAAWQRADVDQKQRVQNVLFPEGLKYQPQKGISNSENDCLFNRLEDFVTGKLLLARPERFELPT